MVDDVLSVSAQELYNEYGRGSGRSASEVRKVADDVKEYVEDSFDYVVGWHKTSHRLKDSIESEGLLPLEESGMVSRDASEDDYFDAESLPDRVYFTVENGGIFPDADSATVNLLGGRDMQLKAFLDVDGLVADEDSGSEDYIVSLLSYGTFAHEGAVKPSSEGSDSWIDEVIVGDELRMPNPVGWHIYRNNMHFSEEDLQAIKNCYDSQLSPEKASILMERNSDFSNEKEEISDLRLVEPEPGKTLEEMVEGVDL